MGVTKIKGDWKEGLSKHVLGLIASVVGEELVVDCELPGFVRFCLEKELGLTWCAVVRRHRTEGPLRRELGVGVAICSTTEDSFDEVRGRNIAAGRAAKALLRREHVGKVRGWFSCGWEKRRVAQILEVGGFKGHYVTDERVIEAWRLFFIGKGQRPVDSSKHRDGGKILKSAHLGAEGREEKCGISFTDPAPAEFDPLSRCLSIEAKGIEKLRVFMDKQFPVVGKSGSPVDRAISTMLELRRSLGLHKQESIALVECYHRATEELKRVHHNLDSMLGCNDMGVD